MAVVHFPDPQSGQESAVARSLPQRAAEDDEVALAGSKMSFLEHLDELRKRLTYSAIALACGVALSFAFIGRIFEFIMRPLQQALPAGGKLLYTEPTEAFVLYLQIGLLAGLIVAAPFIIWQVWLFVAPALYSREKRYAIPFILLSSIGFIGGAAFSHYVVFPLMWAFLASFSTDYMVFAPKIDPVFSLYTKMMLAMGLVFQMPSAVYFLARMGVVTAGAMFRQLKFAVLVIFVVAAVITPSGDMLTQTIVGVPMIGLYLLSILIAWAFGKKRQPAPED
jgi:sec-independent protein translocase protein TatC